ncbi:hypothetical protein B0T19DRAFT_431510 [Cercophora scortea]|uniref:Uncharacterized protein n=1 Tax=Cercophora scortea TaxID=314031 RepID=A0AAE0M6H0_9PEZI|nr:hypothetical protein B0T19DRAFT_431510 [Cercophora scortea]
METRLRAPANDSGHPKRQRQRLQYTKVAQVVSGPGSRSAVSRPVRAALWSPRTEYRFPAEPFSIAQIGRGNHGKVSSCLIIMIDEVSGRNRFSTNTLAIPMRTPRPHCMLVPWRILSRIHHPQESPHDSRALQSTLAAERRRRRRRGFLEVWNPSSDRCACIFSFCLAFRLTAHPSHIIAGSPTVKRPSEITSAATGQASQSTPLSHMSE